VTVLSESGGRPEARQRCCERGYARVKVWSPQGRGKPRPRRQMSVRGFAELQHIVVGLTDGQVLLAIFVAESQGGR
jgi:hypothetical protein